MTDLRALLLVCTLKPSPAESSSELMARDLERELQQHDVSTEVVRVVDHDVRFGVSPDEGDGDEWPTIRSTMLASDILVLCTPIWMGQPSSVCKMVLERLDAELSETDDEGRMTTYGKVGVVGVVGNEDGAHHVIAECLQGLNDVGFSFAANAGTFMNVGRFRARPIAFVNSPFVTGLGATALIGPVSVSLSIDSIMTSTRSSSMIQLIYWSPLPITPPTPSLNGIDISGAWSQDSHFLARTI